MSVAVTTDPGHDSPTSHMSYWVKKIGDQFDAAGNTTIRLSKDDVSRENLVEALKNHDPNFVLLNGHGSSETVCGHNDSVLVEASDTETTSLLKGRIVHTLACEAGASLGPNLVSSGLKAFVGYKEKFKFNHQSSHNLSENEHDRIADIFLEPAYSVSIKICEGMTLKDAYNYSQKMYATNLVRLLAVNTPNAQSIAANVLHDFSNHVLLGDDTAKL